MGALDDLNEVQGNPHLQRAVRAVTPRVYSVVGPTWASVAANTTANQTFTMPSFLEIKANDYVHISKPTVQAGLGIVGVRSIDGGVLVTWMNNTAGALTPTASEVYFVLHAKFTGV